MKNMSNMINDGKPKADQWNKYDQTTRIALGPTLSIKEQKER